MAIRRGKGLTLIELLAGLAVVVAVVVVARPEFTRLLADQRLAALSRELGDALELAREEARRREAPVHLSRFTGQDWRGGWTVWHDADGNGERADGEIIRYRPALKQEVTIVDGGLQRLSFDAHGRPLTEVGLRLCSEEAPGRGRELWLAADGRIESRLYACD